MHTALLLDEILQAILEKCSDWPDKEYRGILCQVAKCCRAWKDPALDKLWSRLDSVKPLVSLLPEQLLRCDALPSTVRADDLANVRAYASRVRQISCKGALPVSPLLRSMVLMPKLAHVILRGEGCEVAPCFKTSKALHDLNITLNHVMKRETPHAMHARREAVAVYLDSLKAWNVDLQTLRLRGQLSEHLDGSLASMSTLRTLTLYAGESLTLQTFLAIAAFPRLERLEVQASHFDASTARDILTKSATPLFMSLRDLKVLCEPEFLTVLLQTLPVGVLQKVRIDTADSPTSFYPAFQRLALIGSHSLQELSMETFSSSNEIEDSGALLREDKVLRLSALRPLAGLQALLSLSIHGLAPPDFCDGDIEQIAGWWPHLLDLNLGLIEDFHAEAFSRLTPAALLLLAKSCRNLVSLTLPMDVPDAAKALLPLDGRLRPSQSSLRYLSMGTLTPSMDCIAAFAAHAVATFPCVEKIDSTSWGGYWLESIQECGDPRASALGPLADIIVAEDKHFRFVTHT